MEVSLKKLFLTFLMGEPFKAEKAHMSPSAAFRLTGISYPPVTV